jgi:hypothetical protein
MDAQQPGVDVDLSGLRMVADALRADAEQLWRPGAARVNLELDHGTHFGLACPGGRIAAARVLFGIVLDRAVQNTARQISAAESLSLDIETVLADRAGADEQAAHGLRSPEGRAAA